MDSWIPQTTLEEGQSLEKNKVNSRPATYGVTQKVTEQQTMMHQAHVQKVYVQLMLALIYGLGNEVTVIKYCDLQKSPPGWKE